MICPNCGANIADSAKFCPKCGAQLNITEEQQANGGSEEASVKALKVIGRIFGIILTIPIWLVLKALSILFGVSEIIMNFGIVRWALNIVLGIIILGTIISVVWETLIWLGIPALFLYVFPYISETCRGVLLGMRQVITSCIWHLPSLDTSGDLDDAY